MIVFLSILASLFLLDNILLRINFRRKSKKSTELYDILSKKMTALYSTYYKLSGSYIQIVIEHLNVDPGYLNKLYSIDRDVIIGMICGDLSLLNANSIEFISNSLLDKVSSTGENSLTQNERLFLEVSSSIN